MTGRIGGVLAAILLALSAGAAGAAPVDVSADQDTLLRHLFGKTGAAGGSAAASGNPYLKPTEKPAVPLPRVPSAESAPISLLPPAAEAKAADATPAAVPIEKKAKAAKKPPAPPLPTPSPAASAAKAAGGVPLPRLRPGDDAAGLPLLELRKSARPPAQEAAASTPPVVSRKDEPVPDDAGGAVAVPPPARAAAAQPVSPPSPDGGRPPDGTIELADAHVPASLPTPPANATPYQLVRALQVLQDQTAKGSTAALIAERQLRTQIAQSFAKADPRVWQDRLNAAAAVTIVLAGGTPDILRLISALTPSPAIDRKLLDGVTAYVEGRFEDAKKALDGVEANDLPASMGGEMALAQAALIVAQDPQRAMRFLDTARLLAPGSLVEEAALRREIIVVDQIGDQEKFEFLARQYLTRFRHSVYAGNFRYRFGTILAHFNFADETGPAKAIDNMFRDLDTSTARELYLTVARSAVVQGQANAAAFAGERAGSLAADGSADQARAHLYRAAALAVLPDRLDNAIAEEKAIAPQLLKTADRVLLDAASLTIEAVAKADTVTDRSGGDPAMPGSVTPSPAMLRAETALQAADTLLRETSP